MNILLVGQPNVGKSSLLNALTNANVIISNYPGTTVDISKKQILISGKSYTFIDTPGAYSLTPTSEEEKVTDKIILEEDYDSIVQVVDATSLERSLIISLQLAELKIPFIIALNFYEDALKREIHIDTNLLESILSVPVVKINPVKKNVQNLIKRINEAAVSKFTVTYDDHIEDAINKVQKTLNYKGKLSKRGIAIKLLENDPVAARLFNDPDVESIKSQYSDTHPNIDRDIIITRAGFASFLAKKVSEIRSSKKNKLNWLDRLIINNPAGGTIFTLFILSVIFLTLFYIGGWFQNTLGFYFDKLLNLMQPWLNSQNLLAKMLVKNSFIGLSAGLSVAVPYVGIFYFLLALMEDSGILSRFIVVFNKIMDRVGLPGKAIIPILLGLGCSVPAIRSTRILPDFKSRLKVSILYLSIPCSSRTAIIFGVVGHYAGITYALSIYIIAFVILIITAKLLNIPIPKEKLPIIEELPQYRKPLAKNLLIKAWVRMSDFVYIVIPLLIVGGMLYGGLSYFSLVTPIVKPLRFLTVSWLHLPDTTIIPLIYGFLQKDLVPAMLANALGTANFALAMNKIQLLTFGLASTFQIPCIIAFGMLIKEFGIKRALTIEIGAFIYGMTWTGIILRIILMIHKLL